MGAIATIAGTGRSARGEPAFAHDLPTSAWVQDADAYPQYEAFLHRVRELVQPIIDHPPLDLVTPTVPV